MWNKNRNWGMSQDPSFWLVCKETGRKIKASAIAQVWEGALCSIPTGGATMCWFSGLGKWYFYYISLLNQWHLWNLWYDRFEFLVKIFIIFIINGSWDMDIETKTSDVAKDREPGSPYFVCITNGMDFLFLCL